MNMPADAQVFVQIASFNVEGTVRELSVSPDQSTWLVTALSKMYFTRIGDTVWHTCSPLISAINELSTVPDWYKRISFFDADTAILTGLISFHGEDFHQDGYFRTTDAVRTWTLDSLSRDQWSFTTHVDGAGNAWIGHAYRVLDHSMDFGRTWTSITLPYVSSDRTYSIHMSDASHGVAGSNDNEILTTSDNWAHTKSIVTPFDQGKFIRFDDGYIPKLTPIEKVRKWDGFIVVNQQGHIFYTDTSTIDWKRFPFDLINFEVDRDSTTLIAITTDGRVLCLSSPTTYSTLAPVGSACEPKDVKVVCHNAFILCEFDDVMKVFCTGGIEPLPSIMETQTHEPGFIRTTGK